MNNRPVMDAPAFTERRKKDRQINALLRLQPLPAKGRARLSQFVYPYRHEGETWLFNLLTRQIISIPTSDFEALGEGPHELSSDTPLMVRQLFEQYFLVPEDTDEDAFYTDLLDIVDTLFPMPQGIETFIILPTTACNLRCFYCFEAGCAYETMTDEIVDETVRYILVNAHEGSPIGIRWFGGEPLMGRNQIGRISKGLAEAGVEFTSSMVSNGTLFDDDIIREAKDVWRLKEVQITLDGFEEEHNRRKNPFDPRLSPYARARESIDRLSAAGISVRIRLNYDEDNFEEVQRLFVQLNEEYKGSELVSVYTEALYHICPVEDTRALNRRMHAWNAETVRKWMFQVAGLSSPSISRHFCMADNPGMVVIGAQGGLYDCECIGKDHMWGNVSEGCTNPDLYASMKERERVSKECAGCRYLPLCTSYTKCPNWRLRCKEDYDMYLPREAERIIRQIIEHPESFGDAQDAPLFSE